MMTVAASRALPNGVVCFVGIGLPSTAANLARAAHAPDLVLIYESGTIGAKPTRLPAVDRGRRTGRDGPHRGVRAGNLQLLAPGGPDRRRFPLGRPIGPLRQPEQHGDRAVRPPQGTVARGRWRTRDRGLLPGGHNRDTPVAADLRGQARLRYLGGLPGRPRATGSAVASPARAPAWSSPTSGCCGPTLRPWCWSSPICTLASPWTRRVRLPDGTWPCHRRLGHYGTTDQGGAGSAQTPERQVRPAGLKAAAHHDVAGGRPRRGPAAPDPPYDYPGYHSTRLRAPKMPLRPHATGDGGPARAGFRRRAGGGRWTTTSPKVTPGEPVGAAHHCDGAAQRLCRAGPSAASW